jgi:hypothetical protein
MQPDSRRWRSPVEVLGRLGYDDAKLHLMIMDHNGKGRIPCGAMPRLKGDGQYERCSVCLALFPEWEERPADHLIG